MSPLDTVGRFTTVGNVAHINQQVRRLTVNLAPDVRIYVQTGFSIGNCRKEDRLSHYRWLKGFVVESNIFDQVPQDTNNRINRTKRFHKRSQTQLHKSGVDFTLFNERLYP